MCGSPEAPPEFDAGGASRVVVLLPPLARAGQRIDFSVTLTVLLFASYADALGRGELQLTLEPGSTVRDVVAEIRRLPGAEQLPPTPLVAVNQAYAPPGHPVAAGDEVALIPPVAGG